MAKHVHAEIIKAWADGAEIEILISPNIWQPCPHPTWHQNIHYRVKSVPHKWQAVIDAWTAGKKVQWWTDLPCEAFPKMWHDAASEDGSGHLQMFNSDGYKWRIKPEKVIVDFEVRPDPISPESKYLIFGFTPGMSNLKLTFEEGELLEAEVLK